MNDEGKKYPAYLVADLRFHQRDSRAMKNMRSCICKTNGITTRITRLLRETTVSQREREIAALRRSECFADVNFLRSPSMSEVSLEAFNQQR